MKIYCYRCMRENSTGEICPSCGYDGRVMFTPQILKPGTMLLDRYLVGLPIGQGGFGITYIGVDTRLDIRVAIKEYFPNGFISRNTQVSDKVVVTGGKTEPIVKKGLDRFLDEARTLATFNDFAGVVDVRDYFELNGTAYIVMEYLEGEDLRHKIDKGLFSADEIFAKMVPVIDAMIEIHNMKVIHRDISPENIMVLDNGSLKLMDFGASRSIADGSNATMTIMLKRGYAPVEQYFEKGKMGTWSDVYAMCATMYKAITGITPPDAVERQQNDEIKWPSELGISITPLQEAVLKKGMAIKVEDRIQTMEDLKKVLYSNDPEALKILQENGEDISFLPKPEPDTKKKKVIISAAIAALAVILVVVFAIILGNKNEKKANNDVNETSESGVLDLVSNTNSAISALEDLQEDTLVVEEVEEVEEVSEEEEVKEESTTTADEFANILGVEYIRNVTIKNIGIRNDNCFIEGEIITDTPGCISIVSFGDSMSSPVQVVDTYNNWLKESWKDSGLYSSPTNSFNCGFPWDSTEKYVNLAVYDSDYELLGIATVEIEISEDGKPVSAKDAYENVNNTEEVVQHPVEI